MSSEIELPKPDKRYKVGNIAKDSKGNLRGHPDTVSPKRMVVPTSAPIHMQLNPPIIVSKELARLIVPKD